MGTEKTILTKEGHQKLLEELDNLRNVRIKDNMEKIKEAKEQGDLSENAEYDAAREEQGQIYGRIREIEELLKNVEIIDVDKSNTKTVNIGCTVRVLDKEFDEEAEYTIVGSSEAKTLEGRISNESPVGRALLGHKKNETVKVEVGGNVLQYKILEIRVEKK